MQLNDITTHIRLRSPWEAADLGFALVQNNWRALYASWAFLLLSFVGLLWLLLPEHYHYYLPLIIWWLKPLYDRILLYIHSRQLFNQSVSLAEVVTALPQLTRQTGLLGALTWRRFSLSRGFNLPIWQLEQLRGKARKERQKLLHIQAHGNAVWITIACQHLEYVIIFSLYALIVFIDPTDKASGFLFSIFTESSDEDTRYWGNVCYTTLYALTIGLIEPFYIGASFSLYLNRRTQLEAWDIELALRNLGERLQGLAQPLIGVLLAVVIGFAALPHTPAWAETGKASEYLATEALPAVESRPQIEAIMQLEEFSQVRTVKQWLPREHERKETEFADWNESLQVMFASFMKTLLWLAIFVLIIMAWVYRRQILALLKPRQRKTKPQPPPDILFGMDIRPESLPDDIAAYSRRLWEKGQQREALSLLYRGALMRLTRHDHLAVHNSHTEGDILQLARQQLAGKRMAWLTAVTLAWQEMAYAHRPPNEERIQPLFRDWNQFANPEDAAV